MRTFLLVSPTPRLISRQLANPDNPYENCESRTKTGCKSKLKISCSTEKSMYQGKNTKQYLAAFRAYNGSMVSATC